MNPKEWLGPHFDTHVLRRSHYPCHLPGDIFIWSLKPQLWDRPLNEAIRWREDGSVNWRAVEDVSDLLGVQKDQTFLRSILLAWNDVMLRICIARICGEAPGLEY